MRMLYLCILSWILYLVSSVLTLPLYCLWIRYVALAFAMFETGLVIMKYVFHKSKKSTHWWHILCHMVLFLYVMVSLDTFVFHALLPIPGMIRYALYDYALPISLFFLVCALLYALGFDHGHTNH